jgi:hypothetical protein
MPVIEMKPRSQSIANRLMRELAQHPLGNGRELPEAVRKTVLAMLQRMGAGN